jgi:hypothetical protein
LFILPKSTAAPLTENPEEHFIKLPGLGRYTGIFGSFILPISTGPPLTKNPYETAGTNDKIAKT